MEVARLLQVDQSVASVKRQLANTPHTWLLVFDNADDPDMSLAPYLPAGDRGDIIVTSRNPECRHYSTVGSREVGTLSLDDSVSLLNKVIYGMTSLPPPSTEGKRIVEVLGCLALAIVQAGAYIRETSCTPQEYLGTYKTQKESVLQYLPKHTGTEYRYSVLTTWHISVDAIKSRGDAVSDHTLRLLSLLGFYHHDQIPMEMFYRTWHQRWMSEVPEYVPWHDTVSDFLHYQRSVQASTSLLASFSLITRNVDASLTLHPLVHEWCRHRMSREEQELSYQQALSLLHSSVEWKFETEDYDFRRTLVSHIHELLRRGECQGSLSEESQMQIWHDLALVLGENGWIGGALQLTETVWKMYKHKLGEDHPDTLMSMSNLANWYNEAGRRTEALEMSEVVLKIHKDKLGEDHPNTLSSMNNLAIRYSEAGRQIEALEMLEMVLKVRKDKLGEDHPDTLSSMNNLANWYSEAGRQIEALEMSEAVWKLYKNKLGEDHPDTLMSMNNLAINYSEAGRRTDALKMSEIVLKLYKNKLGEDHPDTLMSMNNLAINYSEAGRRTDALKMSEMVLKLYKNKLGEDHPDTLMSMNNLALRYSEDGRRTEVLEISEAVWKLYKNKLGEDHPDTLSSMNNLAIRYSEAGRQIEALEMLEMVLKIRKDKLGEDHPNTLSSARLHAYILENIREESLKPLATQHSRHRLSKFWRKIRS